MKKTITILVVALGIQFTYAQKFMTQNGTISFYSKAPMEDIEAVNNQVSAVLDADSGAIASTLLMKAFMFEKALMQEHFNEKYVESGKFPKSTFKGTVENYETLKLSTSPTKVTVKGQLTIHGVTKDVVAEGTLAKTADDQLKANFNFNIALADFNIKIPGTVKDNIAENIQIKVNFSFKKV